MAEPKPAPQSTSDDDVESTSTDNQGDARPADQTRPKEIGGTDGPDPTRYGDWEHNGRCTDF